MAGQHFVRVNLRSNQMECSLIHGGSAISSYLDLPPSDQSDKNYIALYCEEVWKERILAGLGGSSERSSTNFYEI